MPDPDRSAGRAAPDPPRRGDEASEIGMLLHRLAQRRASPWPVVSVYLNTRPLGGGSVTFRPFLKKALGEALQAVPPRSPEHESLLVDLGRVQDYLDYELAESTRSVALFACFGEGDLFEAVQLPLPVSEQAVRVAPLPWLWPLLLVADRSQRAAVLLSDTHAARLFVVSLGRIELRREVRSPLTQRIRGAGESDALHAQRHVDEARKKHARLAVTTLEEMAREAGASWLLVGGEVELLPDLAAALSHEANERLLLLPAAWDPRMAEGELVERVQREMDAREASLRLSTAAHVADPAHAGRTACGLEPVMSALRAAQVGELLLSTAFPPDLGGWSCHACHAFDQGARPAACPVCGSPAVHAVALREELGHQALGSGARVRFVEPVGVPAFEACGGAGALLRYP